MRFAVLVPSLILLGLTGACAMKSAADTPASNGVGYPVFFTPFSADLDDAARNSVASAAQSAKNNPTAPVLVSGFAATKGSPQKNLDLSRMRAQNVSDALVADGVALSRITTQAEGEVFDLKDPVAARRVDISVGG